MPFSCSGTGLELCVRFDTVEAGNLYLDESGNSNTVHIVNGDETDGISNCAALQGVGAKYEIYDDVSLDIASEVTVEAWVRLDSLPSSGRVGILDNQGQYGLFYYAASGFEFRGNGCGGVFKNDVIPGEWFHIAATLDGTEMVIYLNGKPERRPCSFSGGDISDPDPIAILANSPDFNNQADGAIDNLRVWSVARSQLQICAGANLSCFESKLLPSDGATNDRFGFSVSISGDTVVVGAHWNDDNGPDSGSAYIFVRSGATWSEQAKLTASDGSAGDRFGTRVAISGDTVAVGAEDDDPIIGTDCGKVYVFVRSGTTWAEQAQLTASDAAAGALFGWNVAVLGDTIVVGAPNDVENGVDSGSVYIYTRSGIVWTEQAKLTASDGDAGDLFGVGVDISGDTIAVGARGGESAYVYVYSGTIWNEQAILTASDAAANDEFGIKVAISGDTIVVGARYDDDNGRQQWKCLCLHTFWNNME